MLLQWKWGNCLKNEEKYAALEKSQVPYL